MKKLTATLCLTLAVLLGSAGEGLALPKCPGRPTDSWETMRNWTDCFGTYAAITGTIEFARGDKFDT